jgi:hypothetical protein
MKIRPLSFVCLPRTPNAEELSSQPLYRRLHRVSLLPNAIVAGLRRLPQAAHRCARTALLCLGLSCASWPLGPQTSVAQAPPPDAPKYRKPLPGDIAINRALAMDMAERTRRFVVPTMHLVETEHFLIFSAWNRSNDAALADVCERMYQMLAQQFSVPASESVWVGKCPVYIFWEKTHYERFIKEIDGSSKIDANMSHANGYHASKGQFAYVVINGVSGFGATEEEAKTRFYYVLVHEGTHAFLNRYVTDRSLPVWVEEGVAEFVAATLVPQSEATRKATIGSQAGVRDPDKVRTVLTKTKDLTPLEYGIAQSLVRFMVSHDRAAMIRFVTLLKMGQSEEAALFASYRASRRELAERWLEHWRRNPQ